MKTGIKVVLTIIFTIIFLAFIVGKNTEQTDNNIDNGSEIVNNSNVKEEITKKIEVIDFSSMNEAQILTWCNDKNLKCSFKREYSDTVNKDGFVSQSVQANEQVNEKTKITITFSLGKEPTVSQKNAVKMAEEYLRYSAFSRKGLIAQLEYEGFSNKDAVYGVDNVSVDWDEQAVKMAEEYLRYSAFSRKGLIAQLEYEGFSNKQAVYAVEQNGL